MPYFNRRYRYTYVCVSCYAHLLYESNEFDFGRVCVLGYNSQYPPQATAHSHSGLFAFDRGRRHMPYISMWRLRMENVVWKIKQNAIARFQLKNNLNLSKHARQFNYRVIHMRMAHTCHRRAHPKTQHIHSHIIRNYGCVKVPIPSEFKSIHLIC